MHSFPLITVFAPEFEAFFMIGLRADEANEFGNGNRVKYGL